MGWDRHQIAEQRLDSSSRICVARLQAVTWLNTSSTASTVRRNSSGVIISGATNAAPFSGHQRQDAALLQA